MNSFPRFVILQKAHNRIVISSAARNLSGMAEEISRRYAPRNDKDMLVYQKYRGPCHFAKGSKEKEILRGVLNAFTGHQILT